MRRQRITVRRVAAALLLAGLAASPLAATDRAAPESLLSRPWYYTEVVIFQRPAALDHLTEEALTRPPAAMRRDLRTLRAPGTLPSADFDLYPATRAYLAFPFLDQQRLADTADTAVDGAGTRTNARPRAVAPPAIQPRLARDPLLDFLNALAEFEASLARDSYQWLPADRFTLRREAQQLSRRGGFQVLMHGRWLQGVPGREAPEPVLIQVGTRQDAGYTLEGTLDVTLGRYLHFGADLYYREPLLGRKPVAHPRAPTALPQMDTPALLSADALTPAGVVQLRESRRLRSEELNYLDHPKLGVLVRIERVQLPPDLQGALDALRDSGEEGAQ